MKSKPGERGCLLALSMIMVLILTPGSSIALNHVRPNIVLFFSDDLSYRDLSCYGQTNFATPHLDALALNGMRFNQAYAGSPECAPSRASLITGMHMGHCRIRANRSVRGQDHLLAADVTIAEVLQRTGYATGFVGKWGIGLPGTEGAPHKQGFDYAYGFYDQLRAHGFFPDYLMENGKRLLLPENHGFNMTRVYQYNRRPIDRLEDCKNDYGADGHLLPDGVANPSKAQYSEALFQNAALQFIRKNRQGPFFLYYATQLPHGPCITPSLGEFKNRPWSLKHKEWAAMVTHMDQGMGRMVQLLQELKILKNTVIIFAGDNGYSQWGYFGRPAHQDDPLFRNKGPWPKGKFTCTHEGGLRVPLFVYWQDRIKAGQSDLVCALYDILATAADLARTAAPATDGLSLVPTLLGRPHQQKRHPYLYWENGSQSRHAQSLRMDQWWAYRTHPSQALQLYDLNRDSLCQRNVADAHPEVVTRCLAIFREAHEPSQWYINPGETKEVITAKQKRAQATNTLQTPIRANSLYNRKPRSGIIP